MTKRDAGHIDQRGFTLIEVVIVLVVIVFVVGATLVVLMTGSQGVLTTANRSEALQALRSVHRRIIDEVREAGFSPRGTDLFLAVTGVNPRSRTSYPERTGFTLQYDWAGTGVPDPAIRVRIDGRDRGEQVTWNFIRASRILTRCESGIDDRRCESETVITGIQDTEFKYYDESGVELTFPRDADRVGNIRSVGITFWIGVPRMPLIWSAGADIEKVTDQVHLANR